MKRLTRKSLEYKNTWIADGSLSNIEGVVRGKPIDRLAEFEDFMEEMGFDSLEDLKTTLKKCEDKYFKMNRDYQELQHCIWKDTPIEQIRNNYEKGHNFDFVGIAYNRGKAKIDRKVRQENQALKDRWQNLKSYLINTIKEKDKSLKYYKFREVLDKMQELEKE
jgi:hypothetical protein